MNTKIAVILNFYLLCITYVYSQHDTIGLKYISHISNIKSDSLFKSEPIGNKGKLQENYPVQSIRSKRDYSDEKNYLLYRFSKDYSANNIVLPDTAAVYDKRLIPKFYIEAGIIIGFPRSKFQSIANKNELIGFGTDILFNPKVNKPNWHTGIGAEFYPTFRKSDSWSGGDLKTSQTFYTVTFINRLKLSKSRVLSPYLELGVGIFGSYTSTFYLDTTTSIDIETGEITTEKDRDTIYKHSKVTANLSLGFGLLFSRSTLEFNYNLAPNFQYVNRDNVTIMPNEIIYKTSESPVHMLVVGIAFMFPIIE
ncbi:hypothetical protein [Carboxylicivirga marina]|uniref:hypothetical protein n=1 Tax=Carboxylicivirga marina TaxID=2800988 RepID=UPI0025970547|nr:hypothetical protein [uncultured Carboxylicivirga sp.]